MRLVLLLSGCLTLLPPPHAPSVKRAVELAPAAECAALDRRAVGLAISSAAAGALGGAGGGLAPYAGTDAEKYGLAGAGAALSAFAAVGSYLASHYAAKYAQRCTVNVGGSK